MARSKLWTAAPDWAVYLVGLVPAAYYVFAAFTYSLGPDPAKALEHALGEWALRFLILGLAITPLMRLARINLVKYRRAIGLTAFAYVVLHLATYLALDLQFDWGAIGKDIVKRPYITIGMAAFLMLVPLAATGLVALMAGAVITRIRRHERGPMLADLTYLALAGFVAWGRFGPEAFA